MAERLATIIAALADGSDVDWHAADGGTGQRRRRVQTLRSIGSIISAHRTLQPLRRGDASPTPVTAPRTSPPDTSFGTWGSYVLVEHLGAGTSADVFRAYDPTLDRYIALKLLTPFHS